jgi:pilus assembly protein CpaB
MKPKALMLLAVAIGCGLVAMLGVQQAMQGSQKEVVVETRKVLLAIKDIRPGERLSEENVSLKEVPVTTLEGLKGDVVLTVEDYEERSLTMSVLTGDPIRKSKLSEKGQYGASQTIPKGMRIFTFAATDAHTHSGMLRPGDKVDVTVLFTARNGGSVNKVLLECIEIFACENKTVNSEDGKNEQRARNVTLLVTPEQDGFVKIAQSKGQLGLSLRHPDDDEVVNANGVNSQALDDLQHSIGRDDVPGYARGRYQDLEDEEAAPEVKTETATTVDPVPAPVAATPAEPGNVQGFLNPGAGAGPVASVAPTKTKRWSMTIYSGNDPVQVDVEDVQPEPEAVPTSGGVPGMLKSLWSSGQK